MLAGNPGVGKTTIARLVGNILRERGILKIGSTAEVTRENLTSSFVAGVPKATMDCVNRVEEGVLFIDEAHTLGRKDGGAGHDGTGKEVVSTLNSAMTDPNRHFSVILSGYEKEMREVFRLDDGFARRFGDENWIIIDDYPPELLEKILADAIEAHDCRLSPDLTQERRFKDATAKPISCYVNRIYQERDRQRFGNAGAMEKLALTACAKASGGLVTEDCFYTQTVNHEWFAPSDAERSVGRTQARARNWEVKLLVTEKTLQKEIFISFSERKSKEIAFALKKWLSSIFREATFVVSYADIPKGNFWIDDLNKHLRLSIAGILCVTRDNYQEPWLMFEAGALMTKHEQGCQAIPFVLDEKPDEIIAFLQNTPLSMRRHPTA